MFKLTSPCKTCPFRTDRESFLRRERAKEIAASIGNRLESFPCHNTTQFEPTGEVRRQMETEQQCAGVMIICEKLKQPTNIMQMGERIGKRLGEKFTYDKTKLDMDAPVFDNFEDFVKAQSVDGRPSSVEARFPKYKKRNAKCRKRKKPQSTKRQAKEYSDTTKPLFASQFSKAILKALERTGLATGSSTTSRASRSKAPSAARHGK